MPSGRAQQHSRLYGNLPGPVQNSGFGEVFAFYMLLMHSLPPLVVITDYQNLLEGFERGKHWCIFLCQKAAHLRKLIRDKIDDICAEQIQLIIIRAHSSRESAGYSYA